jgi:RNA polymerase-binding transcription factor DksA
MEIVSVFLILAVLIIAGMYLYAPFTTHARTIYSKNNEEHDLSTLKSERDRVINSLQELDFDFKLGKVPADDYPEQRQILLQKGANILRQIDEMESNLPPTNPTPKRSEETEEARIEKAVQKRADASSETEVAIDDQEIEIMIKERRQQINNKSAGFCPKCGKPILVTDEFCSACGKNLK